MNWTVIFKRNIAWNELEKLQQDFVVQAQTVPSTGFLLLSEPHSTFTSGRNAPADDLVWSESVCLEKQVGVERVTRGGRWTYHGPGQILCYPIVSLQGLGLQKKQVRLFTDTFRSAALSACLDLKVPAQAQDEPFGIFVGNKKLASFGLSFSAGISSHGMALYLEPQEDFFSGILPCGVAQQTFTCIHDFHPQVTWDDAALLLANSIEKGFKSL